WEGDRARSSSPRAVGNRVRHRDGDDLSGAKRLRDIVARRRLDAYDVALWREVARGHRTAREQAGAAAGHDEHVERAGVLDQLLRRRALARDDMRVVEGRDGHHAALFRQAGGQRLALFILPISNDLRTVAARRLELHLRRVLRHHDQRLDAELLPGQGDPLGMMAGGESNDAALALLWSKLTYRVVC